MWGNPASIVCRFGSEMYLGTHDLKKFLHLFQHRDYGSRVYQWNDLVFHVRSQDTASELYSFRVPEKVHRKINTPIPFLKGTNMPFNKRPQDVPMHEVMTTEDFDPGMVRHEDFVVEGEDPTKKRRMLKYADRAGKSQLGQPTPDRNKARPLKS